MIERTTHPNELPDWLLDLVILRATHGLDAQENAKLESFVAESSDREALEKEIEKLELAVAAVGLTLPRSDSVMPDSLRQRVLVQAGQFQAGQFQAGQATSAQQKDVDGISHARAIEKSQRFTRREAMGWLAAAASVALLLSGWNPFAAAPEVGVSGGPIDKPVPIADQMTAFLETEPDDLVDVSWAATDYAQGATGQVLWSDKAQEGYMVFQGLTANTPTKSQYQLWIFDTDPAQKFPVDGGVFDVLAGETVVRIDARIRVKKAVQFAVTEERPGGVVVSTRDRLPLIATLH